MSTSMTNPKALFAFPSQEKPKASLLVLYIAGFERRLRRTYGAGHCIFDNDIICVRGLAGTDKGPQISRHGLCEVRRRLSGSGRPYPSSSVTTTLPLSYHSFATLLLFMSYHCKSSFLVSGRFAQSSRTCVGIFIRGGTGGTEDI